MDAAAEAESRLAKVLRERIVRGGPGNWSPSDWEAKVLEELAGESPQVIPVYAGHGAEVRGAASFVSVWVTRPDASVDARGRFFELGVEIGLWTHGTEDTAQGSLHRRRMDDLSGWLANPALPAELNAARFDSDLAVEGLEFAGEVPDRSDSAFGVSLAYVMPVGVGAVVPVI